MKPRTFLGVSSILLILLIAGCASSLSPRLEEIVLPPARLPLTGYSFLPPNEKGWLIVRRTPDYLFLTNRRSENNDETFVIEASSRQASDSARYNDETLRRIKEESERKFQSNKRYKSRKLDISLTQHLGMDCIRGYSMEEDYEAAPIKASGKGGYMLIEQAYVACGHPRDMQRIVRINYSQRYYPDHQDPHFRDKANAVFNTIEVSNL